MPNYCSCRIIITGDSLPEFKKTLNTKNYDGDVVKFAFHQTVPLEKDIKNKIDIINKWGTNSDGGVWLKECKITDDEVSILTETAWSPPILWAKNCMKKFKDLDITVAYCESGSEFYGVWKDGYDDRCNFEEGDFTYDEKLEDYVAGNDLIEYINEYNLGFGG